MKILLVINPKSGKNKKQNKEIFFNEFFKVLNKNNNVEQYFLKDHSGEVFEKYKNKNFDMVVVVGGDGTINTCVNLILKYFKKASLLIIPSGSSNAVAENFNIPHSLKKNLKRLKDIDKLKKIVIDVGYVEKFDKYFLQAVVVGYLATIGRLTDQNFKNKHGFLGYCFKILKHNKPVIREFEMEAGDKILNIKIGTLGIHNVFRKLGRIPTRQIVKYQDGKLDAIFYAYGNFLQLLLSVLYFIFLRGNSRRKLKHFVAEKFSFKLLKGEHVEIDIDGEELFKMSEGDSINCRCLKNSLKILV